MERPNLNHEKFIQKTIELAITSGKKGNRSFGAVLVHQGKIIATAENTEVTGDGYGHAEYNLAIQSAQQFPDHVLQECTFYTSCTPCPRCSFAILALGIKQIVMSVSYEGFSQLVPEKFDMLSIDEIVKRLGLENVEVLGPILEKDGLRAFEYWEGDHRPLEELLANAKQERHKGS